MVQALRKSQLGILVRINDSTNNRTQNRKNRYPDQYIQGIIYSLLYILEDLAPYGGQTSSSCGGLVAFGHQMGAPQAPIWGPCGPPGQIEIHIQGKYKYKYIYKTNRNTYRVQVQIQQLRTNSLWSRSSSRSSRSSSSTKHIQIGLDILHPWRQSEL